MAASARPEVGEGRSATEDELQGGHDESSQEGDEEVEVGDPGSQEAGETDQAQPSGHLPPDDRVLHSHWSRVSCHTDTAQGEFCAFHCVFMS